MIRNITVSYGTHPSVFNFSLPVNFLSAKPWGNWRQAVRSDMPIMLPRFGKIMKSGDQDQNGTNKTGSDSDCLVHWHRMFFGKN